MESLPIFLRLRGQPVLLIGTGEAADAKRRLIEAAGGVVVTTQDEGARLAFVALDDEAEAAATAQRLKASGLLVNVVDRPALCDFTVPAIVDRSPVIVAVGTGGASASLAKALRQRFEAMLPAGLGALATGIFEVRGRLKTRFPDAADRRRALDAAMAEGGPLDPLGDLQGDALDRLLGDALQTADAVVTIVLRSPDPDDLTLREARWLARADRIVHSADTPPGVLDRARRDAVRSVGSSAEPAPGLTVVVVHETNGAAGQAGRQ